MCAPILVPDGGGVRTISLVATDPHGAASTADSVDVAFAACSGNCAPLAYFELSDPHDGDTYFIDLSTTVTFIMGDVEAPSVNFELLARRVGEPDVSIVEGPATVHSGVYEASVDYVFDDFIDPWSGCENPSEHRDYDLVFSVDDGEDITTFTRPVVFGCAFI
jgi:hypothetical protein